MIYAINLGHFIDPVRSEDRDTIVAGLRALHPSDIAETIENSGSDPSTLVEILLQVGNHKAVDAFAQLSIEMQQACLGEYHADPGDQRASRTTGRRSGRRYFQV